MSNVAFELWKLHLIVLSHSSLKSFTNFNWYIIAVWRERTRSFEFLKLRIPGLRTESGKDVLLSHVTLNVAWGSIQGLSEFTLWMLKSLPACSMLFLKQWAFPKLMWRLARLLGFKMAWWLFSSVTWVALTFRTCKSPSRCKFKVIKWL